MNGKTKNSDRDFSGTVILFDMDDTLAATLGLWREAEAALWQWVGRTFDAEVALQYKGMNARDIGRTVHRLLAPAGRSAEDCAAMMRQTLIQCFKRNLPGQMPGAVDCVRRLAAGHRMAVASGSPLELIELTLGNLGVRDCFDVVVSSESVARGKPAPDVFIEAAKRMGAEAEQCLVMEDTLVGVQAAVAAGMRCIVVPSVDPALVRPVATRVCASLCEVDEQVVRQVMASCRLGGDKAGVCVPR